jgi:hypothetical protein
VGSSEQFGVLLTDSVDWRKALIIILINEWHLHAYLLRAEKSSSLESGHFLLLDWLAHGGFRLELQLVRGKAIVGEPTLDILTLLVQLSLLLSDSYQLAELPEELLSTDILKTRTALLFALGGQWLVEFSILDGCIRGGREL